MAGRGMPAGWCPCDGKEVSREEVKSGFWLTDITVGPRYLAMSPDYYNSLSKASQSSLKGQGGPFSAEQAAKLERNDPMLQQKVCLRRFDDGAKVVDKRTRMLEEWWDVACRVYSGSGRDQVDVLSVEKS